MQHVHVVGRSRLLAAADESFDILCFSVSACRWRGSTGTFLGYRGQPEWRFIHLAELRNGARQDDCEFAQGFSEEVLLERLSHVPQASTAAEPFPTLPLSIA